MNPGEKKTVRFTLKPNQFSLIDKDFKRTIEPGAFEVAVGGSQPGFKGKGAESAFQVLSARLDVK